MKKIVLGIFMTISLSVWSYGAEMATISEFPVIACKKKFDAQVTNTAQTLVLANGKLIPEEGVFGLKDRSCIPLYKTNIRVEVIKKTKEFIKNDVFKQGQLFHFAKIKLLTIGGKKFSRFANNKALKKSIENSYFWIAFPYVKNLHMLKFDSGKTW